MQDKTQNYMSLIDISQGQKRLKDYFLGDSNLLREILDVYSQMSLHSRMHNNILVDSEFQSTFDHFLQACHHFNYSSSGEDGMA